MLAWDIFIKVKETAVIRIIELSIPPSDRRRCGEALFGKVSRCLHIGTHDRLLSSRIGQFDHVTPIRPSYSVRLALPGGRKGIFNRKRAL
jgi:hypothetical protein